MDVLCEGEGPDYRWYLAGATMANRGPRRKHSQRVTQQRKLIVHLRRKPSEERVLFTYRHHTPPGKNTEDEWLVEAVQDFFSRVPTTVTYSYFQQASREGPVLSYGHDSPWLKDYTPLERLFLIQTGQALLESLGEDFSFKGLGGGSPWEDSPLHPEFIRELLPPVFTTEKACYAAPFGSGGPRRWSLGVLRVPASPSWRGDAAFLSSRSLSPILLLFLTPEEGQVFMTFLGHALPQEDGRHPLRALPPVLRQDPSLLLTHFPWRKPTLFTGEAGLTSLLALTQEERWAFLHYYHYLSHPWPLTEEEQEGLVSHLLGDDRPPLPLTCQQEGLAFVRQWLGEDAFLKASFNELSDAVPETIYGFLPLLRALLPHREEFTSEERALLLARLLGKSGYAYVALPLGGGGIREAIVEEQEALKFVLGVVGVQPFKTNYLWSHLPRLVTTFGAGEVARLVLAWPVEEDPLTRAEVEALLKRPELLAYPLTWWLLVVREEVEEERS